jgi:DNA polymerase III epsilon subunit-like protein
MRLLFFDTETTGLPKSREKAVRGRDNWPHLVSIAWVVTENDVIVKSEYHIIRPLWQIPEDSTKIHGITQVKAESEGEPLQEVLQKFLSEPHDILIAHNMEFDMNVLVNAILWDANMPYPAFKKTFCTMEASRILCRIPFANGRGYKSPRLSELYLYATGLVAKSSELHNSLYDTQLLAEIVAKCDALRRMIGLPIDELESSNANKKRKTLTL